MDYTFKKTPVEKLYVDEGLVDAETAPTFGDDRGYFTAIPFGMDSKRAYLLKNHRAGIVRAFHGHKKESKTLYVLKGACKVAVIDMQTGEWKMFVLTEKGANKLRVPPATFNGFVSLTDDTELLIISDRTYEESKADDIRLPYDILGREIWEVEHR